MLPNVAFDAADLAAKDRAHLIHPWVDLGLVKDQEPLIVSAAAATSSASTMATVCSASASSSS